MTPETSTYELEVERLQALAKDQLDNLLQRMEKDTNVSPEHLRGVLLSQSTYYEVLMFLKNGVPALVERVMGEIYLRLAHKGQKETNRFVMTLTEGITEGKIRFNPEEE